MSLFNPTPGSVRDTLPPHPIAFWASLFFSASVLTLLISVAVSQLCLSLGGVLYFAWLLRDRNRHISFPPIKLPLAIFCALTVLSIFWAENPAAGGFVVRKLVLFVILLLTVNLVVSARHLFFLLKVMFVEAAAAGILGAVQFIRQYHQVRVDHPHRIYLYMTVQRITGFMGHWMNFGGQQMLVYCALLAFLFLAMPGRATATSGRARLEFWWMVLALILFSIVLNFTRGVWLGCFVGAVYLVASWRAKWLWALPLLVGITLLAGPGMLRRREESVLHPGRDASIAVRFEMWRAGWKMIQRHPLVGVGPDNIPEVYDLYLPPGTTPIVGYHDHLHNDYVQLAAERGLPCFAAWLWFMAGLGWEIRRLCRKLTYSRWVAYAALAGWLALMTEGFFEFNFGSTPVLTVFLFLIATPFAAEQIERRQREFPEIEKRAGDATAG